MRLIDADVLKQHIDKLPALPDGNFAGNHSALKALINMQPTIEPSTNCSEIPNGSDDTISRQAAIDLFPNDALEWDTKGGYIAPHLARRMIEELPSAQPEERKKGAWISEGRIIRCSECKIGYAVVKGMKSAITYNFCPSCGAEMI